MTMMMAMVIMIHYYTRIKMQAQLGLKQRRVKTNKQMCPMMNRRREGVGTIADGRRPR